MFLSWKNRIVDVYIFKQILGPFLFGVAVITIIMLSSFLFELTDLIIIRNVPLNVVLGLLSYQLPEIIVKTFPMAVLFATLSALGRLNRENEITGLRMGGISLYRLIVPVIVFGLIVSFLTYYINESIVPLANHRKQVIINQKILEQASPDITEDIFFKGPQGRLFYIEDFNEKKAEMFRVVIFNKPAGLAYPEIITADRGLIRENKWQLYDGIIHQYDEKGSLKLESRFKVIDIELDRDLGEFYGEQKTPSEMNRKELAARIAFFRQSGIRANTLLVEYYLKLAVPFISLIFILIGIPLSLGNSDRRGLNIILMIAIIFSYYFLLSLSRSMGCDDMLEPLLAAFLPNFIFGIIGIMLLFFRESWQNGLNKLLSRFFILLLLFFPLLLGQGICLAGTGIDRIDEPLHMSVDKLSYNAAAGEIEGLGNIMGKYGKLYLKSERIIIKMKDGGERIYNNIDKINLSPGSLSGCGLEDFHYYIQAKDVTIYPDDHLEASHAVLWELNGRLPLFYWPYLYMSLKEESQRFVPQIGYNANRGWFLKMTYNYWYKHRLPGAVYVDYYNISGTANGFMQYFIYEPERKGSFYYYSQENETGLPGLFDWEARIDYKDSQGSWQTDTVMECNSYQDRKHLKGDIELTNVHKNGWFSFYSDFDSLDYEISHNDEKELDLDFRYTHLFEGDWELNLDYNRDYQLNQEDGLQKRWGSKTYLAKNSQNKQLKFLLERYAPQFSEENDEISFYRWPEVTFKYYPNLNLIYQTSLGRYYEDRSKTAGYRFLNRLDYNKWMQLTPNTSLRTQQVISGKIYRTTEPDGNDSQGVFENKFRFLTVLSSDLSWINKYKFTDYCGESLFLFDKITREEEVQSRLNYRLANFNASLSIGYDIYSEEYLPCRTIVNWQPLSDWYLGIGTSYNFNTNKYNSLALNSRYQKGGWRINSAFRFDLNKSQLERWDNQLVYNLKNKWYFEVKNSYDYQDKNIKEANFILKKNFHCRELWFSYDYLNSEFMIEYHINLLPDHGFKFSGSKDEPYMFDLGIWQLLEEEGDY